MEKQGKRFADDMEKTRVIEKTPKQEKQKEKPKANPPKQTKEPVKNPPAPPKKQQKAQPAPKQPTQKELLREEKKREKQRLKDQRLKEKNAAKLEKKLKKQRKQAEKDAPVNEPDLPVEEERSPEEERADRMAKKAFKIHKKRIIAAVVIIVLLFGIVFFISNPERFSIRSISNFIQYGILNHKSDEHFPLDISGKSISPGDFLGKEMDICYSSDTQTQQLNNYGKTVFSVQHAFINPVLTTSKKNTLVYNLGGTGYQVIDSDKNVRNLEAKDNIMVADITDSGVYALVTQSGGYLSKLYVYDEKDEQIFAYSFSEYYVTAVTLCDNGRQAVCAGLTAQDGMDIAALYVLDFTAEEPLYIKPFEDNIIYDVQYLNDRSVCAVGRSASYVLNTSNGNVAIADYAGKMLTAYDINTRTDTYTLSLSNSGDGRNCNIVSYNSSGKEEKSFSVVEKITDLSTYKGRVALLTGDSVLLYSKDGKKYSEKALRSDPHTVVLYTGSDAYVLCTGYIDTIHL